MQKQKYPLYKPDCFIDVLLYELLFYKKTIKLLVAAQLTSHVEIPSWLQLVLGYLLCGLVCRLLVMLLLFYSGLGFNDCWGVLSDKNEKNGVTE